MQTPHRKAGEIVHLGTNRPQAGIEPRTFLLRGGSVPACHKHMDRECKMH